VLLHQKLGFSRPVRAPRISARSGHGRIVLNLGIALPSFEQTGSTGRGRAAESENVPSTCRSEKGTNGRKALVNQALQVLLPPVRPRVEICYGVQSQADPVFPPLLNNPGGDEPAMLRHGGFASRFSRQRSP
jgi:hypothetical protein